MVSHSLECQCVKKNTQLLLCSTLNLSQKLAHGNHWSEFGGSAKNNQGIHNNADKFWEFHVGCRIFPVAPSDFKCGRRRAERDGAWHCSQSRLNGHHISTTRRDARRDDAGNASMERRRDTARPWPGVSKRCNNMI